jgi:catechol 2,3-dioxygenase-like lactoylglutathione lyase family enzyme
MGARCDAEEANFLTLNLAHEIIIGVKGVEEARRFYAEAVRGMRHVEYKQGFRFPVSRSDQGDPDHEVVPARRGSQASAE